MHKSLWNEEYYETLTYYYWEPQHLGKKSYPDAKYNTLAKVLAHVRNREVSLNHQFNTFFSLLPSSETRALFYDIFREKLSGEFCFNSKATREFTALFKDATQPDLYFPSDAETVCIELKVGKNKSDFDQVMKYLLLSCLENERSGREKPLYLLYLGEGQFHQAFKEKCTSIQELKEHFLMYEIGNTTRNKSLDLTPYREKIYTLSQHMRLVYLSYSQLYRVLQNRARGTDNEALVNIYAGMLSELESRGYANTV